VAATLYRYKFTGPTAASIARCVPGAIVVGALSPTPYLDVTADSLSKSDLDDYMETQGYVFDSTAPTNTPAQSAAGSDANKRLLEKFISGAAEGWPSGVYREVTGGVFPSAVTWWTSSAKVTKIADAVYTRNGSQQATTVVWKMYASDGTTVLSTITDVIAYTNGAEVSRTRTIA
jgi:hypothetical protein